MGKEMHEIYNLLSHFGFKKKSKVMYRMRKLSNEEINKFFDEYYELAKERPLAITASPGVTDIYPDSRALPFSTSTINQLAIYVGKIYYHDPLLKLATAWPNIERDLPMVLKYKSREDRVHQFKLMLGEVIEELLDLRPLVDAGILYITPVELYQDKRVIGDIYSDDFYGPQKEKYDPHNERPNMKLVVDP